MQVSNNNQVTFQWIYGAFYYRIIKNPLQQKVRPSICFEHAAEFFKHLAAELLKTYEKTESSAEYSKSLSE